MKKFLVNVNGYDTDGEDVDLPNELEIEVSDELTDDDDIEGFIENEISNITGFCHYGFTYEIIN